MTTRSPRFGIILNAQGPVGALVDDARRAADAGFDSILISDHLGFISPLAPLAPIAAAVPSVRVGTCVLNTAFYRPALLARELTAVASATEGRLEIGLGAGYAADEFAVAGLPFPTPGQRLRLLTEHVDTIRSSFTNLSSPLPLPPIMIAGSGDRLLAMAAQKADILTIGALTTEADLAERVDYVKGQAGERFDEIELAFGFFQPSLDDPSDMRVIEMLAPESSDAQRRAMATVLDGSVSEAADRITRMREDLGITYFQFSLIPGSMSTSWDTLKKLLVAARP
jgi:probable F420-dependent oxidoreductase